MEIKELGKRTGWAITTNSFLGYLAFKEKRMSSGQHAFLLEWLISYYVKQGTC